MAAYRVVFDREVTYLPGHPTGERQISVMDVYADDEIDARDHALRTTVGGRVSAVVLVGSMFPAVVAPEGEPPAPDPQLSQGWAVGG